MIHLKDDELEKINDSIVSKSDETALEGIIEKAHRLLCNIGVKTERDCIIFKMMSPEAMMIQIEGDVVPQQAVGICWNISISGKKHIIWLLENIQHIFLLSVVAHEMGHVWCRNHHLKLQKIEEEGFCELLGYHILSTQYSKIGNHYKKEMIENPHPIYGAGLRLMKEKFENFNGSWTKFLGFIKLSK